MQSDTRESQPHQDVSFRNAACSGSSEVTYSGVISTCTAV
jgi:hypothetical protein